MIEIEHAFNCVTSLRIPVRYIRIYPRDYFTKAHFHNSSGRTYIWILIPMNMKHSPIGDYHYINHTKILNSPGSRVDFVVISLFYAITLHFIVPDIKYIQKKSGCLFHNPITFSIEGVFQNDRLNGYTNIRMTE